MQLMQLIYSSQPFGFDSAMLISILADARRCNKRDGITGLLVCRADLYLQLLEGPRDVVTAAFTRIARDDRHAGVMLISCGDTSVRMFPAWDMQDDPARSWLWTQKQIAAGALNTAQAEEVRAVFQRVAKELAQKSAQD